MRIDNEMLRQGELDLLVDGELAEEKREALLSSLDAEAGGKAWRALAIRFLERQVEKQTVRGLMGGQTMIGRADLPRRRRFTWWNVGAVAAGMMIAAGCVGIGMYAERMNGHAVDGAEYVEAHVPVNMAGVGGVGHEMTVSVPVVNGAPPIFDANYNGTTPSRRSVIFEPDGKGNTVAIPVNSLPMKVY